MRKELFFCSAVLLSATLAGCGYDDGRAEPLLALAEQCTTNFDCKSGNAIIGDCVLGRCLRFCSIETAQADCESGDVCEGGLCRPVVDCPELQVADSALISEYRDKKCVQVFSTTPGVSWSELLQGDIIVNEARARDNEFATDFASSNYDFAIPHESLYAGMNFSVVTLAAITYLRLLVTTASMVAECTKPQHEVDGQWVDYDFVYTSNYQYIPNDDPMTPQNLQSICNAGTNGMNEDMQQYLTLAMANAGGDIKTVITNYQNMIRSKPTCLYANYMLQILEGISSVVMEMGMSSALESTTLIGAQQVLAWLDKNLSYSYTYDNSPVVWERNVKVGQNGDIRLDSLEVASISVCDETTWKANVQDNAKLAQNLRNGFVIDDNAKDWNQCDTNGDNKIDQNEKDACPVDPKHAKNYKKHCNIEDAAVIDPSGNGCKATDSAPASFMYDGKCYVFNEEKANGLMTNLLVANVMQTQIHSCMYMMLGMNNFPLMQALASSPELKFAQCANNENRVSAMLDVSKFSGESNQLLLSLLQGKIDSALTQINQAFVDSLAVFANKEVIYNNFTDPTLIWLSAHSPMALEIREKSSDYSNNDLILEVDYSSVDDLFKKSENTRTALAGAIKLDIAPEMYISSNNGRNSVDENGKYVSQTIYQQNVKNGKATGIVHRSGGADNTECTNCRLYFHATSQNQNVPMVCGGFTYKTNQVNGYIVLTDDDLKNRVGMRERIVKSN